MHPCLGVDEILRLLAREIVASKAQVTAVSFASCCKSFEDPVLDALWGKQDRLTPLLKCLPQDVWKEEEGSFSFKRIPTKAEWIQFRKHARRMRKLRVDLSEDPVASDTLFALQLYTTDEPFLPRLKTFKCKGATEAFTPFIPSFLSHKTVRIKIEFDKDTPTMMVASMITRLPMLCPNLELIALNCLRRDPAITKAASEMLLACNRDTLQRFLVDSPLTEEARGVICQLPGLSQLWVVIQGRTLLPPLALPNLALIDIEYDDHLDWLQGFRGQVLEELQVVHFSSESDEIGDVLGEFESVALTTSAPAALLEFAFITSRPWNPNYRSLLPFTQLTVLAIESSCDGGCSSTVDDDIVMDLVRAMPELEELKLGDQPCETPTGITTKGLIALARGCPHLSKLCIHFRVASLVQAGTSLEAPLPEDETMDRRQDCALTDLIVGEIPIPEGNEFIVTIALLQIFPRLYKIISTGWWWEDVLENIKAFKRIGAFVHRTGDALNIGVPPEGSRG